jgi:hypothetical protein
MRPDGSDDSDIAAARDVNAWRYAIVNKRGGGDGDGGGSYNHRPFLSNVS